MTSSDHALKMSVPSLLVPGPHLLGPRLPGDSAVSRLPPDWSLIREVIRQVHAAPGGGLHRRELAGFFRLPPYGESMRDALGIAYRHRKIDFCGQYVVRPRGPRAMHPTRQAAAPTSLRRQTEKIDTFPPGNRAVPVGDVLQHICHCTLRMPHHRGEIPALQGVRCITATRSAVT
jgi:hypothetical protein